MKTHITLFAVAALFFAGSYTSVGQEDTKKQEQEAYSKKKRQVAEAQYAELKKAEVAKLMPEDVAKKQTQNLQQLLNLDEKQAVRIYEICLGVENEISKMPTNIDEGKKTQMLNDLEKAKSEKFKEALTSDQFEKYQSSLSNMR